MPRSEIIHLLSRWSGERAASMYLIRVPEGNYREFRDVVQVAPDRKSETIDRYPWFRPGLVGTIQSIESGGDVNLTAPYCVAGADAGDITSLSQLLGPDDVAVSGVRDYRRADVGLGVLVSSGLMVALSMAMALSWSLILARVALSSSRRAVQFMEGAPTPAMVASEVASIARVLLPSMVGGLAVVTVIVLWRARPDLWLEAVRFYGAVIGLWGVTVGVVLGVALCVGWPSVRGWVDRRPGWWAFHWPAHALKFAALLLAVLSVPTLAQGLSDASAHEASNRAWRAFDGWVTVRFGPMADDARLTEAEASFGRVVAEEARRGHVALSYDASPMAAQMGLGGYGGLVLIDAEFMRAVGLDAGQLTPLADAELPEGPRDFLAAALPIWLRPGAESPRVFGADVSVPAVAPGLGAMGSIDHALVVLVDDPGAFTDSLLVSAASTGNLMFSDRERLAAGLRQEGVEHLVLSLDEAADVGLLRAQLASQSVQMRVLGMIASVGAVLATLVLAATISVAALGARLFAERTSGASWWVVLRRPLCIEALLMGLLLGALAIVVTRPGTQLVLGGSPWMGIAVGVAAYAVVALVAYFGAATSALDKVLWRKVT